MAVPRVQTNLLRLLARVEAVAAGDVAQNEGVAMTPALEALDALIAAAEAADGHDAAVVAECRLRVGGLRRAAADVQPSVQATSALPSTPTRNRRAGSGNVMRQRAQSQAVEALRAELFGPAEEEEEEAELRRLERERGNGR